MKYNTTYVMPKEQVELMMMCFNCGFCDFNCSQCKYNWRDYHYGEVKEVLNEV